MVRRRDRHLRTPGLRLVEPTARREGRPYPGSKQVIHELSGLSKPLKELTKGGRAEEFQFGLGAKGNYIFVL
jgi:hypothetical protein